MQSILTTLCSRYQHGNQNGKQKLKNYTGYRGFTLDIYRDALTLTNEVAYVEWRTIETLLSSKARINYVENLIQATATNICPKSGQFDSLFNHSNRPCSG